MATIKTSENIEFDVIYADGTRRHVAEGVLFEVENEKIVFHNGTNRPEVIIATAEAAAEVLGRIELPVDVVGMIIGNIVKNILTPKEVNDECSR